jgi:Ca2+-transporting ATPase
VLALNNNVTTQDGRPVGDPTEVALFDFAERAGYAKADLERTCPRLAELAFDSTRQRMTTIHDDHGGLVAYTKGAPEALVPRCRDVDPKALLDQAEALASEGYRVLALAERHLAELPDPLETVEDDLRFLGLIGLIDPPRREASRAVAECRTAGITPVMITGDHPGTALAIAKRLGIAEDPDSLLTGADLAHLSDDEGEFVAMTGDGVNDAPALERAGIGIAMGRKGTDVARGAADLVLLDDDFATIVAAVREGRRIFDNILKFIKDTMSSNSGEIWTLFLAPFLGLPVPLLPIHILWINLVTDGLPGLAFTAEPEEPGTMNRPPRPPGESIFAHGMWQHIVWVGLFVAGPGHGAEA